MNRNLYKLLIMEIESLIKESVIELINKDIIRKLYF